MEYEKIQGFGVQGGTPKEIPPSPPKALGKSGGTGGK